MTNIKTGQIDYHRLFKHSSFYPPQSTNKFLI